MKSGKDPAFRFRLKRFVPAFAAVACAALCLASCEYLADYFGGASPSPSPSPSVATRYDSQKTPSGARYVFLNWNVRINPTAGVVQAAYYRVEAIGADGNFLATDLTASSASASDDGKRIILAFTGREGGVTANAGTFVPRLAVMAFDFSGFTVYPIEANAPAFIPGRNAACYERSGKLYGYDFDTGIESGLPPPQPASDPLRFPRYSPDGKYLAYIREHGEWFYGYAFMEYTNTVFIQDTASGTTRQLAIPADAINYLAWSADSQGIVYHTQKVDTVNAYTCPTNFRIYRISIAAGAAPERITDLADSSQGSCGYPTILPDGRILAVSAKNQRQTYTGEGDYHYDQVHDLAAIDPASHAVETFFLADLSYPSIWDDSCGDLAWPMYVGE